MPTLTAREATIRVSGIARNESKMNTKEQPTRIVTHILWGNFFFNVTHTQTHINKRLNLTLFLLRPCNNSNYSVETCIDLY